MSKLRGYDVTHDKAPAPMKEEVRVPVSQKRKKSLRGFRYEGEVHLKAAAWMKDVRED